MYNSKSCETKSRQKTKSTGKYTQQNTKRQIKTTHNYDIVASYDTRPRNEIYRLILPMPSTSPTSFSGPSTSRLSSLSIIIISYHRSFVVHGCQLSATELSDRRCSCLERTTTPSHVCTVPRRVFWQSSQESSFRPFLPHTSTFCSVYEVQDDTVMGKAVIPR